MKGYKPEDGFVVVIGIFTLLGMWPASIKFPTLRFIYITLGYCFHGIYYMILLPSQIIILFLSRNNLQKLIDCSFLTTTLIVCGVKLVTVILKRKKIEELLQRLSGPIFMPSYLEHFSTMGRYVNNAKIGSIIFLTMSSLCVTWWIMFPKIDKTQENVMLFEAWYPFNVTAHYNFIYAYQSGVLFYTSTVSSMTDMLVTSFFITIMGQIEMLKIDFRQLADTISKRVNQKETYLQNAFGQKLLANFDSKESKDYEDCDKKIYRKQIAKYVDRHKAILTYIRDVTDTFHTSIMVQLCGSCLVICSTSFEMTMLDPTTIQFYAIATYQLCMLVQIFLYTFGGNGITIKSSELMDAIYECAWTSVPDKKFRQLLCIIMSRLQIPVTIRVWNFFLLSLNTFINVLKSAYTFYILLKKFQTKND